MRRYRRSPGALARIRVYPEDGSSLYAVGVVWRTKREMREHLRRCDVEKPYDTAAINMEMEVIAYKPGRRPRKLGLFSEVHFSQRQMGGGLVAHEFFHTTCAFARRVGIPGGTIFGDRTGRHVTSNEERLCMAHGRMVAQFINRCWKLGLYRR